ncbi:proline iminopeptidase [Clostridium botulinum]|uniref:proline iminopeptidase n=1 Tax=Clostridium botulinum TaxID=1491 RepID=UPI00077427EB|nr:proline iminopeptidase-family hydrolase [Clostridium botulinum]MBY6950181.1 proline iminopeptidase-family hydrolase [Clostridium botulinum]MCR1138429.1 proline iminopeptidase-family hydrolase [Clostridium botulinum]NEZ78858.1 alpha/beta fold hydrolase [Clostridium botulinum]NFA15061.1 alpha/beta fold hydrolase [Clostridium botulinum]NFA52503.1 alpha/beta fold hydrolase [Clostridium botulinum]
MKITEGYMPYLEYKTYYRIVGKCTGNKKPLVLLHGGPGSTHNYFEVLDKVAEDGRAVIMYDQLGCGLSATPSRPDLWNAKTWIEELIQLRKHLGLDEIHLLGQSWGGMQAIQYACEYKPEGIKSYILSSTLPAASLWEKEQRRRVAYLPQEMQDAIAKAEKAGDHSSKEYQEAEAEFMLRHCAGAVGPDSPECLRRPKVAGTEAYVTAWGQNEFSPSGTLKNFDFMKEIEDIKEPCLITSGLLDLCSPLVAKTMYDKIPNSEWELFEFSRHMPFVEENEKYIEVLNKWLNKND